MMPGAERTLLFVLQANSLSTLPGIHINCITDISKFLMIFDSDEKHSGCT